VRATASGEPLLNPANPRERYVLEQLEYGYDLACSDPGFQRYLDILGTNGLNRYTPRNIGLIFAQFPDASAVMGRGDREGRTGWRAQGRRVKDGSLPINILAPKKRTWWETDPETGERHRHEFLTGFKIVDVYDVSQTDGPPIAEPPIPQEDFASSAEARRIDRAFASYGIGQGLRMETRDLPENLRGFYSPMGKQIVLNNSLPDDDGKAKTLGHELAHYESDHKQVGYQGRSLAEFVAEASIYAALKSRGVDTSRYSIPYLLQWTRTPDMMQVAMPQIAMVTKKLIAVMEGERPEEIGEWL
jgi:hypothetical protein